MMNKLTSQKSFRIINIITLVLLLIALFVIITLWQQYPNILNKGQHIHARPNAMLPDGQGMYESCSPAKGSVCLNRLQQMANAGFTVVVNYDQLYGTQQQELAYAQQATALHMQIIWAVNDPVFWSGTKLIEKYRDLAPTCKCSDNTGFIRYVVGLVKNLPATWGYYVGDEVKASEHARMKAFSDFIKQLDPSHPRLFVASGNDSATMSTLTPFVDTADVLAGDIYPVGTNGEAITVVAQLLNLFSPWL